MILNKENVNTSSATYNSQKIHPFKNQSFATSITDSNCKTQKVNFGQSKINQPKTPINIKEIKKKKSLSFLNEMAESSKRPPSRDKKVTFFGQGKTLQDFTSGT